MNRASISDRLTQVETNNAALKLEVQELRALINPRKDPPEIEHGKGKRFKAEATILTKDEVVERLQKEHEEKARHTSEMEKKKRRAAQAIKKEEDENAAYYKKKEKKKEKKEKKKKISPAAARSYRTFSSRKLTRKKKYVNLSTASGSWIVLWSSY